MLLTLIIIATIVFVVLKFWGRDIATWIGNKVWNDRT